MKVVVTGGTGLIGSRLVEALRNRGDTAIVVSRSSKGSNTIQWEPKNPGSLQLPEGTDAIVHLAGAPLFGNRWSKEYKQEIRESRVQGTKTVVQAIKDYDGNIDSFLSGAAVGYYGDRGDEQLTESSKPADDYLANVCVDWERVARDFSKKTGDQPPNVSILRTGIVLSPEGGALKRMLNPFAFVKPFHWGLGGPLGFGQQFMAWIHMADEIGIILHILDNSLSGTFNLTAPNPVQNKKFTNALGSVLHRPTLFPVPKFGLRMLYGEAADVLYASQRVIPDAIRDEGYQFQFPEIEPALRDLLKSPGQSAA